MIQYDKDGVTLFYVDATGKETGEHGLKPKIDLPTGLEIVTIDPANVKLNLSAKRPRRATR